MTIVDFINASGKSNASFVHCERQDVEVGGVFCYIFRTQQHNVGPTSKEGILKIPLVFNGLRTCLNVVIVVPIVTA